MHTYNYMAQTTRSHQAVVDSATRPTAPQTPKADRRSAAARGSAHRSTNTRAGALRVGKYKVARRLHKGRVAHVMLASTAGIGGVERQVALKLLRSRFAHDSHFSDSFLHEERVTGSLQHPNLVQMLDSGESEYGPYMTMEYIKGWNLEELMRAAYSSQQAMPVGVALTIAYSVAAGLHYLHELLGDRDQRVRVVHRNVRPDNVMVTENGFVKLLDFGDVAIEGMEREQPAMLSSVTSYTPPEQIDRDNSDRRGDIYSLGILLYELTTGQKALRADDTGEVVPPSAVCPDYPADLENLVMHMVHPDPDRRLQSAATLQLAFEDLAAQYATPLSPRQVAQFARRLMDKRRGDDLVAQARAVTKRNPKNNPRRAPSDPERTQVHIRT